MKKVYKQFTVDKQEWVYFGYKTFPFYECYNMYLVEHHADCEGELLPNDYIFMTAHYKWWVLLPLLCVLPFVFLLFGIKGSVYYLKNIYNLCISHNDYFEHHTYTDSNINTSFHNLKLIQKHQIDSTI